MNIDDDGLRALWQSQHPPSELASQVASRVQRHRRNERFVRGIEIVLTVAGIAILTWPAADGGLTPGQWLLIPFFVVFLVASWTAVLRRRSDQQEAACEPVSIYAAIRRRQLQRSLRHLKLASASSVALLAYALVVLVLTHAVGSDDWQQAAGRLVAGAVIWAIGTGWLVGRRRAAMLREYRQIELLVTDG